MKKYTLISATALALILHVGSINANNTTNMRKLTMQSIEKKAVKRNAKSIMPNQASPLKTSTKAGGYAESVLINEDFSALTSGYVDKPDTTQMLACEYTGYSPNGIYIDNSLTKDGTWFGSYVYSAGGAIALKTYNPQQPAYLCTPLGDYSGDLTITLRVKANPAIVATDEGYVELSGSDFDMNLCYGGYEDMKAAKTDDEKEFYELRLYEKDGWQEVTYTCKNYTADNGGYICFSTEGSIVIDDIKVKAGSSFLASPAINGITDFQKDQFTISWQPTRKAYNYYVDLYKRNYLSDEDSNFKNDFNEGIVGDGWESTSQDFSDNEGADGSKALILRNGDSFITPTTGNDYKSLHFFMKTIDNTVDTSNPYAQYYVGGAMNVDLKTVDGWKNIGEFYASGFWKEGDEVKMEEEFNSFKTGGYTQLRLRPTDLNEGAYFVVDNFDITAKPAYEYEIVGAKYYQDIDNDYAYTDYTSNTSYTFKDLDPETEYYYGVRAHYVKQFSSREFIHALGVAAPELAEASDIDSRGSFTANWNIAPKATGYTVNCYGITTLDKDENDYPLLEEDFSRIDASMTAATDINTAEALNNNKSSLDAYTKLPGWTGSYNTIAQSMLGAEGDYDYVGGSVSTPQLYLANDDKCKLTMKMYGDADDEIAIKINDKAYYAIIPKNGILDGYVTLPVTKGRQSIKIYSYDCAPILIDYIKVSQDLKAGAKVLTYLDSADTDATTTSYTFTGLDAYDFLMYGYDVTSHFQYDDNTKVSSLTPSNTMFVDLVNGTSTGIEEMINDSNVKVVARYTADGQLCSTPVKGLNILKLSNGKTMKIIVK